MSVTAKPRIDAFIGSTGSGKGVSVLKRLDHLKPRRLLIWDPRDEYKKQARRVTLSEAVKLVSSIGGKPFAVRVVADDKTDPEKAFAVLCQLAFRAGDLLFLAEELSDVTKASWAPPAWRKLMTQGRHRGLHIIGATQRPALVDKSFLGGCTYLRCFTLRYKNDRAAVADTLDVPLAEVSALQTIESETRTHQVTDIHYIERDFRVGKATKGHFQLRKKLAPT